MTVKGSLVSNKELQILVEGCLQRDRRCQQGIYNLLAPSMMVVCLRYTRSREEAEEVLQDGFVSMFRNIDQFKNIGSFEGWLRRIVVNCALQKYRSKKSRFTTIHLKDDLNYFPSTISSPDRLDEKEMVRLIQRLPPAFRMVFNLYVFEGYKHREIAEILGINEGTSKSNLFDARTILKKYLTPKVEIAR